MPDPKTEPSDLDKAVAAAKLATDLAPVAAQLIAALAPLIERGKKAVAKKRIKK